MWKGNRIEWWSGIKRIVVGETSSEVILGGFNSSSAHTRPTLPESSNKATGSLEVILPELSLSTKLMGSLTSTAMPSLYLSLVSASSRLSSNGHKSSI